MAIQDFTQTGTVNAAGRGTLTFRPPSRQNWSVQQVATKAPNVGQFATSEILKDGSIICQLPTADGDTAAGDPPIMVRNGHKMTVEWYGATVGASLEATIVYDDGETG